MASDFPGFMRLPVEIRLMIWREALPEPRVYEVMDVPNAKQKMTAEKGLMFANLQYEPPPAMAAVCTEARAFVLRHYRPLTLSNTTKFVDVSRDILLLEPYLLVKRLLRTLHFLSQLPLLRDHLTQLALGTSYGLHTGICHPILSWKVSRNNMAKLLAKLACFPALRRILFVVHQDFHFEFDFRIQPSPPMLPSPPPPSMHLNIPGVVATNTMPTAFSSPSPASSLAPSPTLMPAATATGSGAPPRPPFHHTYPGSHADQLHNHSHLHPSSLPPSPPPSSSASSPALSPSYGHGPYPPTHNGAWLPPPHTTPPTASPTAVPHQPRPQTVHQAYRFKFDIETSINHHHPRRPHRNEFLFYPLSARDDDANADLLDDMLGLVNGDDLDGSSSSSGSSPGLGSTAEWCDPWPTNDDWRRFRRRFQRAINACVERRRPGLSASRSSGPTLHQYRHAPYSAAQRPQHAASHQKEPRDDGHQHNSNYHSHNHEFDSGVGVAGRGIWGLDCGGASGRGGGPIRRWNGSGKSWGAASNPRDNGEPQPGELVPGIGPLAGTMIRIPELEGASLLWRYGSSDGTNTCGGF